MYDIKMKVKEQSPIPASFSHSVEAAGVVIRVVHQQLLHGGHLSYMHEMTSSAESLQVHARGLGETVVAKTYC